MTVVGEPQNLIIAEQAKMELYGIFLTYGTRDYSCIYLRITHLAFLSRKFKLFGYGEKLPDEVWKILSDLDRTNSEKMSKQDKIKLGMQALIAIWLILGLAFHLATVGLIGLSIIIFASSFTGVTDEHTIGKAFQESLPFTALLLYSFLLLQ